MKTKTAQTLISFPFGILFFVLTVCFQVSYAGDVRIGRVFLPSKISLKEVPVPVEINFKNDEAFPVTNLSVTFQIRNFMDELQYNVTYSNITVQANSTLRCSSYPNTWTPPDTGWYELSITSFSPVDIDLSNNDLKMEFRVLEKPDVLVEQLNLYNPFRVMNSSNFSLGVDVPASDEVLWLNVLARKPMSTNEQWIVQNMPLLPFHSDRLIYYPWYASSLEYEEGEDVSEIELSLSLSSMTRPGPFLTYSYETYEVQDFNYIVGFDITEEIDSDVVPAQADTTRHNRNDTISYSYRGCDVPNIDLDSSSYKPTELYSGDWNACGPAAAANSLEWLETQHPDKLFNIFGHRDKMTVISKLMEREDEKGVTTSQLVKGKLGFIDLTELPIHVKYQSWFNRDSVITSPDTLSGHVAHNMSDSLHKRKPPTWEFLKSEIEKGEDVEILFGWYDHGTNRHGGHWVTISGIVETDTLKGIFIKDDGNQAEEGGTKESYLIWQQQGDWSRLVGYDGANNYCWVESVVSESYDSTITHSPATDIRTIDLDKINKLDFRLNKNPIGLSEDVALNVNIAEKTEVYLYVYNFLGQLIHRDNLGRLDGGEHSYSISSARFKSAGQYLIILTTPNEKVSKKLLIINNR
jgi:hypothetical protein